MRLFLSAAVIVLPTVAFAAGSSGPTCSPQRLAFCKSQGMDDGGFGEGWLHNHCKKSPSGPRFEYLVPTWQCLHNP